jgi:hypothetical protein
MTLPYKLDPAFAYSIDSLAAFIDANSIRPVKTWLAQAYGDGRNMDPDAGFLTVGHTDYVPYFPPEGDEPTAPMRGNWKRTGLLKYIENAAYVHGLEGDIPWAEGFSPADSAPVEKPGPPKKSAPSKKVEPPTDEPAQTPVQAETASVIATSNVISEVQPPPLEKPLVDPKLDFARETTPSDAHLHGFPLTDLLEEMKGQHAATLEFRTNVLDSMSAIESRLGVVEVRVDEVLAEVQESAAFRGHLLNRLNASDADLHSRLARQDKALIGIADIFATDEDGPAYIARVLSGAEAYVKSVTYVEGPAWTGDASTPASITPVDVEPPVEAVVKTPQAPPEPEGKANAGPSAPPSLEEQPDPVQALLDTWKFSGVGGALIAATRSQSERMSMIEFLQDRGLNCDAVEEKGPLNFLSNLFSEFSA